MTKTFKNGCPLKNNNVEATKQTFTYSNSTIQTPEKGLKYFHSLQ